MDRNPVAAEEIQAKLNHFVDRVRVSLQNRTVWEMYQTTLQHDDPAQIPILRARVEKIRGACPWLSEFFHDFAGQGRVRWHYGE